MVWRSAGRFWRLSLLLGCVLGWGTLPARAQISLHLDSARSQYLVDECFYVTITLTNVGIRNEPFLRLLEPEIAIVTFDILGPEGPVQAYEPGGAVTLAPWAYEESVTWLAPGESYASSADLSWGTKLMQGRTGGVYESGGVIRPLPGPDKAVPTMVLSAPGEYWIRACYTVPHEAPLAAVTLWSNDLHITVVEPVGEDLAAYEAVQTGPYDEDRQEPWNAAAEKAECYERVILDYPTSAYATYARWSLGSVRGIAGMHYLRGTPQAAGCFEEAADLFQSVARDAGRSPFGLRATEAAAKNLARLGRAAEAQALLEEAFVWPSTTDSDRARLLSWMDHIETGYFWRSGGLAGVQPTAELSVPFRQFAEALGFSVVWAGDSYAVTVSSPRMTAVIRPGERHMLVNSVRLVGVRTSLKDGRTMVSPSVIATLMAEHYGKGMAKAFSPRMIAQAQPAP